MRELTISRYKSRFDKNKELTIQKLKWADLVRLLADCKRTSETFEEYKASESVDKLGIKDVGYFVGGEFNPPLRKAGNLKSRSVLALDLDHLEAWDIALIREAFGKLEYIVHSSHSHSEESPRLRLVMPFTREVTTKEYEPIARRVAQKMGLNYFDGTTYQFSRVMFLPSASSDGDVYWDTNVGKWIDPDVILGTYEDWGDFGEWPQSDDEIEKGGIRARAEKAANPFEIPGIIGAFNRAFPIDEALESEILDLPYEESGMGEDRYSCTLGKSADGAIFYRDDGHLFSWHESDPAKGNRNAWDLVRLHRFGELDIKSPQDTPISKLPSQKAMVEFAETLAEVRAEWAGYSGGEVIAEDEFEDVTDSDTGVTIKVKKAVVTDYDSLIRDLTTWAENQNGFLNNEQWEDLIVRASMGYGRGQLSDTELDVLADEMRVHHWTGNRVAKAPVLREVKVKSKQLKKSGDDGDVKDIQMAFLQNFERQFFKGGEWLRRHSEQFWQYTGTHWERMSDEQVSGKMVKSISDLRESTEDKKELRQLIAAVGEGQTSAIWNSLKNMYQALKTEWTSTIADDPRDPIGLLRSGVTPSINCLDGEIYFRDGQFRMAKHNPESLFTNVIPVRYDPKAECPMWDHFCQTAFQNSTDPGGLQRHLEELCGYILNQSRKMRCWALLFGPTGSGKSTVGEILTNMMGDAMKGMPMKNYEGDNSHATAGLVGKQLLLDDDYKSEGLINDSFVKTSSDEKRVSVNPKGKSEVDMMLRIVLMVCSNNPPLTSDTSGALADRALVIPFNHSIPYVDRDPEYVEKMKASEFPGVFMRFVRGAARLLHRGHWDFPIDCTIAWEKWINDSNPLPAFLKTCYIKDPKGIVRTTDMGALYDRYMELDGRTHHMPKGKLYSRVETLWKIPTKRHETRGWEFRGYSEIPGVLDGRSEGERGNDNDDFNKTEDEDQASWDC